MKNKLKNLIKPFFYRILQFSINLAIRSQDLLKIKDQITEIVPDVTHQYTTHTVDSPYLITKVRGLHAFQVYLASYAVKKVNKDSITIVDIGDSAGTHIEYLNGMFPKLINPYSVNLDPVAVQKIKDKGLRAINTRAEDLLDHPEFDQLSIEVFLLFETMEHLLDPIGFLRSIREPDSKYFVLTVPYVKNSRVGFSQIRNESDMRKITPENTHIFELSPSDWELIFQFTGWEIEHRRIYRQYPWWSRLIFLDHLWRVFDFEGFYGVVLKRSESNNKYFNEWNS
tara:strand:+ start:2404 stop:3252 length:849 start_codon:yes stop_codon:yes gene_type:complete